MAQDEAARILASVRAAPVFRRLPLRRLRQVVAASRAARFSPGQVILRQGALGDAFYVVLTGRVRVQVTHPPAPPTPVATLGPGQYFGELALLSPRPRTADVIAETETETLVVPRAVFEDQLLADARFKAHVLQQSQERENELLRRRVASALQGVPLFQGLRWDELLQVALSGRLETVPRGTTICRQGDVAAAVYVLLAGEVEVRVAAGDADEPVAALAPPMSFGELSVLAGERMRATLRAVQDSSFLVLDKPSLDTLLTRFPFARGLSRSLWERLQRAKPPAAGPSQPGTVVVVRGTAPGVGVTTLTVNLALALARQAGRAALVDLAPAGPAARYLGLEPPTAPSADPLAGLQTGAGGVAVLVCPIDDALAHVHETLAALRRRFPYVLIDASAGHADSLLQSLTREADALVVLAGGEGAGAALLPGATIPEMLVVYSPAAGSAAVPPSPYATFHLPRSAQAVAQFRPVGRPFVLAEPQSFLSRAVGRLARYLTRQQVGLVLAGGVAAAPSLAGVLAGLEERGVDVDLIVSTGVGSLLAAAYAAGLPVQSLRRLGIAFYTPRATALGPALARRASLAYDRRLCHWLRTLFGSTLLETLQVPLWIVASDADTGDEVVLRSGPVSRALEASLGLRASASRLVRPGRPLLDSSVLNPIPVQLLREMGADVAVAIAPPLVLARGGAEPTVGRGRRARLVLALQTLRLAGQRLASSSIESADVVITLPVGGESGRLLFERGRDAAFQAAPQILARQATRLAPDGAGRA
jgi:NTE family protein